MSQSTGRPALRWAGFTFAALVVASSLANAQAPWKVTVTATDPLAVGSCSAVALIMSDTVTFDRPRGPNGAYLAPGDFDITVTAADSMAVTSHRIDRDHTVACACQKAKKGTVGTVKASYPARSLAPAARAKGVAF